MSAKPTTPKIHSVSPQPYTTPNPQIDPRYQAQIQERKKLAEEYYNNLA